MKVLLVQSYLGGKEPPVFPLGLACIKSALPDHEARVFDTNTSKRPFEELKELAADFMPDVAGISLRNIDSTNKRVVVFYYPYLRETLDAINSSCNARIVIGGPGFSMFAREILDDEPRIDYGIHLEGETAFPQLLHNLDSPEKVKSVYYRKDGQVLFSGPAEGCDMTMLRTADRSAVALGDYMEHRDSIGVETKRGCMLNCVYCAYGFLNGKTYRLRNPAAVADEIEQLVRDHRVQRFMFVDSVFNIPLAHAEEICREIITRRIKIKWSAWFNEKNLTTGFIQLVRDAGCDHMILSPDAFSGTVLRELGKNITTADIREAYRILSACEGLEIGYNFFKNPPGQHIGNVVSMAIFCLKAKLRLGKRVHFEFNSLRIEPHTRLHELAMEDGLLGKNDGLLYPKYYTNRSTSYIQSLFDLVLRLKGK